MPSENQLRFHVMARWFPTLRTAVRTQRDRTGAPAYAVAFLDHNLPQRVPADALRALWLTVENRGSRTWRRDSTNSSVRLAVYLDGAHAQGVDLPRAEVCPGERATLCCTFRAPIAPGRHELRVHLTGRGGALLEDQGAVPLCVSFDTVPQLPALSTQLMEQAPATNHWHFRPS